jgi:hypothetical protein
MTLFMLIVAMDRIVGVVPDVVRSGNRLVQTGLMRCKLEAGSDETGEVPRQSMWFSGDASP